MREIRGQGLTWRQCVVLAKDLVLWLVGVEVDKVSKIMQSEGEDSETKMCNCFSPARAAGTCQQRL